MTAGFLLRAVAGGVAAPVPLSEWFLLVAAFGSLFMVAGKRYAELQPGRRRAAGRGPWSATRASYLRFVWSLAAAVTVIGYCLWAFEVGRGPRTTAVWAELSVAPFVLAILRYAVDVDGGDAGAPEDIVLRRPRAAWCSASLWLVIVRGRLPMSSAERRRRPLLTGWGRTAPTRAPGTSERPTVPTLLRSRDARPPCAA